MPKLKYYDKFQVPQVLIFKGSWATSINEELKEYYQYWRAKGVSRESAIEMSERQSRRILGREYHKRRELEEEKILSEMLLREPMYDK